MKNFKIWQISGKCWQQHIFFFNMYINVDVEGDINIFLKNRQNP